MNTQDQDALTRLNNGHYIESLLNMCLTLIVKHEYKNDIRQTII